MVLSAFIEYLKIMAGMALVRIIKLIERSGLLTGSNLDKLRELKSHLITRLGWAYSKPIDWDAKWSEWGKA